jgi:hypothetical protein
MRAVQKTLFTNPCDPAVMMKLARFVCLSSLVVGLLAGGGESANAADCEATIGKYMIGQALLAANYVAAAEKAGMKPAEINAALKDIAASSPIEEFWITDSNGRAYLTNTGIDFTFNRDPATQPQASAFWRLIAGTATVVVQPAQKREIDNRVFKYVGVAGVDKPRIVQVGVSADNLACR